MDIFRAIRQKLRTRWQLAAASFLIAAIGSFAVIMVVHMLLTHTNKTVGETVSASVPASVGAPSTAAEGAGNTSTPALGVASVNESEARKALFQKLAIDDARLDQLEQKRQRTPHPSASTRQRHTMALQGGSTIDDVRAQLTAALVHLLSLEKTENADNPEIIAVRQEITRLQGQTALPSAITPPGVRARRMQRPDSEVQLDELDAEISVCGAQIIADMQQLAHAPRLEHDVQTQHQGGETPLDIGPPAPITHQASHVPTGSIVAICIALGVMFSILTVLSLARRDETIRDETMLRNLLPVTTEYIGTIPRMKTS